MSNINKLFLVFLLSIFVFFIYQRKEDSTMLDLTKIADRSIILLDIQNSEGSIVKAKDLKVEVVNSRESIQLGLSGRPSIGADGMLFIFKEVGNYRFWMKEMLFDIDIIWLLNGQIVDITKNVPKPLPNTPLEKLPNYSAKSNVNMVLEVNANQADNWGLKVGDKIRFK